MQIIGFTGLEGSGKDTAAKYAIEWAEAQGKTATRQGFADNLKVSAAMALGAPVGQPIEAYLKFINALKDAGTITLTVPFSDKEIADGLNEVAPEQATITGRDYLRWYGTEAHRDLFGYGFWIDALFADYNGFNAPDFLMIPDVRFDNEAKAIEDRDGIVVEIHRPDVEATGEHVSEAGLSDGLIACSIRNDTDLDNLRDAVFNTLDALLRGA